MARKRPPGRPKGNAQPRDMFMVRPSIAIGQVVRDRADELDMAYGAYISKVLAEAFGMPKEAPKVPGNPDQQELPLHKTA